MLRQLFDCWTGINWGSCLLGSLADQSVSLAHVSDRNYKATVHRDDDDNDDDDDDDDDEREREREGGGGEYHRERMTVTPLQTTAAFHLFIKTRSPLPAVASSTPPLPPLTHTSIA